MERTGPRAELPQAVDAISIDKSRRVFYSAMPLRTRVYDGFTRRCPYGSGGVYVKGDILMQRFITLLSLMLCAVIAIIVLVGLARCSAAEQCDQVRHSDTPLWAGGSLGIPHKQAIELVFDEINSQGAWTSQGRSIQLEVVAYDHKYVIAEGVATVNRLISKDDVKYLEYSGGAVAKANEEAVNEAGVLDAACGLCGRVGEPEESSDLLQLPVSA